MDDDTPAHEYQTYASLSGKSKPTVVQLIQDKIHQRGMQVYKYDNVPTFLSRGEEAQRRDQAQLQQRLHAIEQRVFGKVVIREGQLMPVLAVDSRTRQSPSSRYNTANGGIVFSSKLPRSKRNAGRHVRGKHDSRPY